MSKLMMEKRSTYDEAKRLALSLAEKYADSFNVILSRGAYYVENGDTLIRSWEVQIGYAKPIKGKRARWIELLRQ